MDDGIDRAPDRIDPDVPAHLHAVQALTLDVAAELWFLGDVAPTELGPDTNQKRRPLLLHGW